VYNTLADLHQAMEDKQISYKTPKVFTLQKGEYIVMHPKLWHSGWSANEHNVRLHFYFGMKEVLAKNTEQSRVLIMNEELQALFNGQNYSETVKSIKKRGREKSEAETERNLTKFGGSSKHDV